MKVAFVFFSSVLLATVSPIAALDVAYAQGTAWLSLSRIEMACDLTEFPSGPVWVNVRLENIDEFAGCRLVLAWGSDKLDLEEQCYALITVEAPTAEGFDCTWMNRGWSIVELDTLVWGGGFHLLQVEYHLTERSPCAGDNAVRFLFDFGGCSGDEAGHICLLTLFSLDIYDRLSAEPDIMSSVVIRGGGSTTCPCCGIPEPWYCEDYCPGCKYVGFDTRTTWGSVKAMYR